MVFVCLGATQAPPNISPAQHGTRTCRVLLRTGFTQDVWMIGTRSKSRRSPFLLRYYSSYSPFHNRHVWNASETKSSVKDTRDRLGRKGRNRQSRLHIFLQKHDNSLQRPCVPMPVSNWYTKADCYGYIILIVTRLCETCIEIPKRKSSVSARREL